jgi:hypothetical protein
MATAPNTGSGGDGAPVGLNLPFVSEGDSIKASDINNLSSAIEKISIGLGAGYEVNTYGRRSTMTIDDQTASLRSPWHCVRSGQKLLINVGNVFVNGTTNEFRPLSSYGFRDAGINKGAIFSGNNVKFEVPGADAADSAAIKSSTGILTCNFLAGYYYIEVEYNILSNLIDNILTLSIKGEAFLRHSATPEGIGTYISPITLKKNQNVYPVCTVTPNAIIVQGVRSDIFARGPDLQGKLPELPDIEWPDVTLPDVFDYPFKIKLEQLQNGSYTVNLVPGTVCNVMPTYDNTSTYLYQQSPWTYSPGAGARPMFIYLACKPGSELEANGGRFPYKVEARRDYHYNPETYDKDDEGTLLIGVMLSVQKTFQVNAVVNGKDVVQNVTKWVAQAKQFVSTSVWAERRKYSNLVASYYFFRV